MTSGIQGDLLVSGESWALVKPSCRAWETFDALDKSPSAILHGASQLDEGA
jgi:hypothetical protein